MNLIARKRLGDAVAGVNPCLVGKESKCLMAPVAVLRADLQFQLSANAESGRRIEISNAQRQRGKRNCDANTDVMAPPRNQVCTRIVQTALGVNTTEVKRR
ncbi:MAG: hypothetical protein JWN74_1636 [Acidobacteriaceae bacterium]|nr:hypothetical protein [Acidobacteriaceae bacterium]